jgi:hypothetical protein
MHLNFSYDEFNALDNELWDILENENTLPYTRKTGAESITYYHFTDGSTLCFDDNPHSQRILIFPVEGEHTIIYKSPL